MESSVFLNLAISFSSFECKSEVPVTNLEPPVPVPYLIVEEMEDLIVLESVVNPK